jgi:cytochrome c-type biogenesis protein CcmH/NrfF
MEPWLAWLLPVPLATVGAILWASWSSRARGPEEAMDSVAQYDRFRSAMASPVSAPVPAPRGVPARQRSSH